MLVFALMSPFLAVCQADKIIGNVRIQVLSPTLVRIELRGSQGFEDCPIFHVTERNWLGTVVTCSLSEGFELIETADFQVILNTWIKQFGDPDYDPSANLDQDTPGKIDFYDFVVFCRE